MSFAIGFIILYGIGFLVVMYISALFGLNQYFGELTISFSIALIAIAIAFVGNEISIINKYIKIF